MSIHINLMLDREHVNQMNYKLSRQFVVSMSHNNMRMLNKQELYCFSNILLYNYKNWWMGLINDCLKYCSLYKIHLLNKSNKNIGKYNIQRLNHHQNSQNYMGRLYHSDCDMSSNCMLNIHCYRRFDNNRDMLCKQ